MDKKSLRLKLLQEKKELTSNNIQILSQKINQQVIKLEPFQKAKSVFVYASLPWEVDTSFIWKYKEEKKLVFPKVEKGELKLIEVENKDQLQRGIMGIMEPHSGKIILPEEIDLVIVPGVAYDRLGYRLGYGGGFYDKILPLIKGFKVGVVFEQFRVEKVPTEEHDVPVDVVVTESGVFWR